MTAGQQLPKYDAEQLRLMEEMCIQVTEDDCPIGPISKLDSHVWENIAAGKALHRAFSVFLFNNEGKLLLQQRAMEKITFPGYWTNTCCSHPLFTPTEMDGEQGVRRAAIRKLEHELGIANSLRPQDFHYLTKIRYEAASCEQWGECEVDYILFAMINESAIPVQPSPNEVMATRYVDQEELKEMFSQAERGELKLTPWFRLICDNFLFKWWKRLNDLPTSEPCSVIHAL